MSFKNRQNQTVLMQFGGVLYLKVLITEKRHIKGSCGIGHAAFLFSSSLFVCLFFRAVPSLHMEVPRPGVESKLLLLAYTIAIATQDLSCICDLHRSAWQCRILKTPMEAKARIRVLMNTSRIHFPLRHDRNSNAAFLDLSGVYTGMFTLLLT